MSRLETLKGFCLPTVLTPNLYGAASLLPPFFAYREIVPFSNHAMPVLLGQRDSVYQERTFPSHFLGALIDYFFPGPARSFGHSGPQVFVFLLVLWCLRCVASLSSFLFSVSIHSLDFPDFVDFDKEKSFSFSFGLSVKLFSLFFVS